MLSASQIFDLANTFVLPFWALILLLPKWSWTRRVIQSPWPFLLLASVYLYLLSGTITAESAAALANPKLADIARFFSEERAAATGWVHFLVMDLFVGRWIYTDGIDKNIWTTHSIALCLFAGPLGVFSHLVTVGLVNLYRQRQDNEAAPHPDPNVNQS